MMRPAVLTIAGLDPTGGAGVIADCRILARHGAQPLAIVSAITEQDTSGVYRVVGVEPALIRDQLRRLFRDIPIAAVKTGLLPDARVIEAIAETLPPAVSLTVDPVLSSSGGFRFLDGEGIAALKKSLLARASVITPNREEAQILSGSPIQRRENWPFAAERIRRFGVRAVLLTDGDGEGPQAIDRLFTDAEALEFSAPRIAGASVHGAGCALSSAIAAQLAWSKPLPEAVRIAKEDVHRRIEAALLVGRGRRMLDFS